MEKLNRELQNRVWERVQSREPVETAAVSMYPVKALLLMAQENNVAYSWLMKQIPPRNREKMARLRQETQRSIACMQGICRLRGEQGMLPRLSPERESVRRTLEKCYRREQTLRGEWERRIMDPEHGAVYAQLAEQGRNRCALVLEMIGEMGK